MAVAKTAVTIIENRALKEILDGTGSINKPIVKHIKPTNKICIPVMAKALCL
jgi:hypothetical protein